MSSQLDSFEEAYQHWANAEAKLHYILEITDDPLIRRMVKRGIIDLQKGVLFEQYRFYFGIELSEEKLNEHFKDKFADEEELNATAEEDQALLDNMDDEESEDD